MKRNKQLLCLVLVLLCLCAAVSPVKAARLCSLTVFCEESGTPLVGAEFSLYLVATPGAGDDLIVEKDFAAYHVNISRDQTAWPQLAATLAGYAAYDKLVPLDYGVTDGSGRVHFGGLAEGIYLVVGELHRQNEKLYSFEPALVTLPGTDASGNALRDVEMSPKAEWIPDVEDDDLLDLKVLKVWEDGAGINRPHSVTVHLLRDGSVIDTVKLGNENRWRHTWENLAEGHQYAVVEEPVPGYTVTVTRQGITFVVKNTVGKNPPPVPDAPEDPDQPEPPADPQPGTPGTLLPETGQPWAWVLLLTAAGLGFLVLGLYVRRGKHHEA